MLAALIIVFREALEAGLIIGIVLAAAQGLPGRGRAVGLGLLVGLVGSVIMAIFAGTIGEAFDGSGQELLTATILAVAVLMLIWHVVWMSRHGRTLAARLRQVGGDVAAGRRPLSALSIVVGAAVLREGFEVVLFMSGIALGGEVGSTQLLAGAVAGLALAGGVSLLTYSGLVRLSTRYLFAVTGWLITLLAAGLAAQAAGKLQTGGFFEALNRTVWNTSAWLPEDGPIGFVLHTLVGYTDRPSELQLLVYGATLVTVLVLSRLLRAPERRTAPAAAPRDATVAP